MDSCSCHVETPTELSSISQCCADSWVGGQCEPMLCWQLGGWTAAGARPVSSPLKPGVLPCSSRWHHSFWTPQYPSNMQSASQRRIHRHTDTQTHTHNVFRTSSAICTWHHVQTDAADHTYYLTKPQDSDNRPTSLSTDPTRHGAWQGSLVQEYQFSSCFYDSADKSRERSQALSVEASGTGTGGQADTAEEVGLDQTHLQEASIQHHTPSPDLEPTGEEEGRPASQQLETRHWSRAETASVQLVWDGQSSPKQCAMARGRRWPMLHRERWA